MYDCTDDVIAHKSNVLYWMNDLASQLMARAKLHDNSKLQEPEKPVFDEWTSNLNNVEFGSEAYQEALAKMGEGLKHHYHANRHHPEHWVSGIDGMTLIDLIEMFCDWLAAAEKKNTCINLDYLQERFNISPQLIKIFLNTLWEIDFISEMHNAPVPQFAPIDKHYQEA